MAKKITGRQYGLEFGTMVLNYLFKSKSLHYGFWTPEQEIEVWNFGKAQANYTQNIIKNIPEGVKTILDVGCGTGVVAKELISYGYEVECISPSIYLAEEVRKNIDGIKIYECKFEDFESKNKYDLILFSESFQYIDMNQVFDLCFKILKENGYIQISDMFKTNPNERGPIGGGKKYQDYLDICKEKNLELVSDQDISNNIAPTFDIIQDFSQNLLKPAWARLLEIFSINRPLLYKIVSWKFDKKIKKMDRHFRKDRNAKGFLEYNTYRVMVWKRR